jgi:phosphonatase-like hydrolase
MPIDMVVFDMAGTTVWDGDNAVARCVCDAIAAAGVSVELRDVDPVMGMPKPLAIRTILADKRGVEPTDEEVERIHADFQARSIEHYRTSPNVRAMDDANEVFTALRARGIRVTLDTGFDRAILDTIVTRLGWTDLIDDSVASDEVEHGRPDPELIHVLMGRAGITDAGVVAKIGDSESDLEQGMNAGCGLVGAVLCERTREVLGNFPDAHPVANLTEFLRLVESHDEVAVQ